MNTGVIPEPSTGPAPSTGPSRHLTRPAIAGFACVIIAISAMILVLTNIVAWLGLALDAWSNSYDNNPAPNRLPLRHDRDLSRGLSRYRCFWHDLPMTTPDDMRFIAHLPIGEQLPAPTDGIPYWDICPYDGDVRIKVLRAPELPEEPRWGEAGAETCGCTANPDRNLLWTDGRWSVRHSGEPTAIPMVTFGPVDHYDLIDLPADLSAELGPMIQRVEKAIVGLGGIGRVHVNKWGDGSAHLHIWMIGRPAGMTQLKGTCLPLWDDVLPPMPTDAWRSAMAGIAESLAAGDGAARAIDQ